MAGNGFVRFRLCLFPNCSQDCLELYIPTSNISAFLASSVLKRSQLFPIVSIIYLFVNSERVQSYGAVERRERLRSSCSVTLHIATRASTWRVETRHFILVSHVSGRSPSFGPFSAFLRPLAGRWSSWEVNWYPYATALAPRIFF